MVELLRTDPVTPIPVYERIPGRLELHEVPPRRAAVVRVTLPMAELPAAVGPALGEVAACVAAGGATPAGPPFARYLSADPARLVAEIGVPILGTLQATGRVEVASLPGGTAASMVHQGGFERIGETYGRLFAEIARAGLAPAGPTLEIWWSDPVAEPDSAGWVTELLVPVR